MATHNQSDHRCSASTRNDPRNYLWRQISYHFHVHRERYVITSKPPKPSFVASMFTHDNTNYTHHETEVDDVIIEKIDTQTPRVLEIFPGFYGNVFKAGDISQVWVNFHVPTDYVCGTKIYPHIHWSPLDSGGGSVTWVFEYVIAKGWGQSTFPTSAKKITVTDTAGGAHKHMVTEVPESMAIYSDELEPDTTIKMRIYRDGKNDSYGSGVHAWQADLSYQSENIGTYNRRPAW